MAQLTPLPLTVSYFSKIQIGITFLVLAHPDNPRQNPEGRKTGVCVLCVSVCAVSLEANCYACQMHIILVAIGFSVLNGMTFRTVVTVF